MTEEDRAPEPARAPGQDRAPGRDPAPEPEAVPVPVPLPAPEPARAPESTRAPGQDPAPEPAEGLRRARRAVADEAAAGTAAAVAEAAPGTSFPSRSPDSSPRVTTGSPSPVATEPPSPDVSLAESDSVLPGAHRGGFTRLPTAPSMVQLPSVSQTSDPQPVAQWVFPDPPHPHPALAGWALTFAVIGLGFSLFVGWGFPLGMIAVVTAIVAVRRPLESRAVAVWALVLGSASVLYSAGWLLFAANRANLLG